MGMGEHGGNPTFGGLPTPYYQQITAAWQQINFPSVAPKTGRNPVQGSANGRRRFIYVTQPIFLSGSPTGADAFPIDVGIYWECTTRAPMYFAAATAPFNVATQSSSSSVNTVYSSSSSSNGIITTFGFLFACEEGT